MIEPELFFKLLSDPTRLRIVLLLHSEGELCVCELVEALDDSQPKISRHLAQLRAHGLLIDSRRGQWVYYSLANHLPAWVNEVLRATGQSHTVLIKPFRGPAGKTSKFSQSSLNQLISIGILELQFEHHGLGLLR